jgi:hypothetical protein
VNLFKRLRGHKALRYASLALTLVIALIAAAIVVAVTVDLGPVAKPYAERYGSRYLQRDVRIGALRINVFRGRVQVENLSIAGLQATDRPFFTAKTLAMNWSWLPAFALKPDFNVTSVELTDWVMLVEKWPNRHSFPRLTRNNPSNGPRRFTTTVKWLRAARGQFIYEDHETPWGIICRNLDIDIGNLPKYHGTATFSGGTVTIQDYVPMWANMKAAFDLDGPLIKLSRVDLETDGAVSVATGVVDAAHWPEQTYQVQSRVNFPRMRELFFKNEPWALSGDGDFAGTFHLFNGGSDPYSFGKR